MSLLLSKNMLSVSSCTASSYFKGRYSRGEMIIPQTYTQLVLKNGEMVEESFDTSGN